MNKRPLWSSPLSLSLLSAAVLSACAVNPDYQRPSTDLPAAYGTAAAAGALAVDKAGAQWWTLYGDPALDRLVEEALQKNTNLQLAVARVDEARAQLGITRSYEAPSVDGSFSRSRSESSSATGTLPPGLPRQRNDYRAAVNVSYELDLWGRLRSATAAARADLLATEAARDTVRITLAVDVVQAYYGVRALNQQVAATERAIATRRDGIALQEKRRDAGVISSFELAQLQSELSAAEAQLPALERQRLAQETALSVLLGRSPRELFEAKRDRDPAQADIGQAAPVVVPAGLPSDLLLRRPDIVQAEQRLIAANARIAAARASLFPAISLTGMLGSQSAALDNLFTGPAGIWSLAAGVLQPIFAAGRLRAGIEAAESRERQAVLQYQQALQTAFREVRDALDAQFLARQQFDAESRRVAALTENLRLARLRYDNGVASHLDVLDAERNLLGSQLNRADALRTQRAAVANLFRALGGGWEQK